MKKRMLALTMATALVGTMPGAAMAASSLMIIPPMVLYLCGSRYLVEGIKTSGLK